MHGNTHFLRGDSVDCRHLRTAVFGRATFSPSIHAVFLLILILKPLTTNFAGCLEETRGADPTPLCLAPTAPSRVRRLSVAELR